MEQWDRTTTLPLEGASSEQFDKINSGRYAEDQ